MNLIRSLFLRPSQGNPYGERAPFEELVESGRLVIEPCVRISPSTEFDIGDDSKVILRKGCQIRERCHFEVYNGGIVDVGPKATVGINNWFQGNGGIHIGEQTVTAPNVCFVSTTHGIDPDRRIKEQALICAPVVIGEDVWIGASATIASGVTIGDGAVVGANSFVNKDVGSMTIVGGVPCRFLKERSHPSP